MYWGKPKRMIDIGKNIQIFLNQNNCYKKSFVCLTMNLKEDLLLIGISFNRNETIL